MKLGLDAPQGWIAAAGALATLALAAPALAAPLAFECDVPPSHYSELTQAAPGPAFWVTGRILVEELRRADNDGPAAGIQISAADGRQAVLLRLVSPSGEKKAMAGQLLLHNGDRQQTIELGRVDGVAAIPFKLSLSDTGKVDLQLGDLHRVQDFVPLRNARVTAYCATGEFNFRDLVFPGQ